MIGMLIILNVMKSKKLCFKFWKNFCCADSKEENQWVYDIYSNGKIKYCSYPVNRKKIINKFESYTSNQTKKHSGDISGGTIDNLVLDFLLTVPDINKTLK